MDTPEKTKRPARKPRQSTATKLEPPDWFGWMGVIAVFLLPVVRVNTADGAWFFPLLSLGEWLLLPMGVMSLTMGLLTLWNIRERTLLPLWLSAIFPAMLWLAGMGAAMLKSGVSSAGGDMFLSWAVHLLFPTMAFLPLLAKPRWRDRLMWALAAGLVANIAMIFWQGLDARLAAGDTGRLGLGGFLVNQHDYGLMLAIALPLLAAWRGGGVTKNRALTIMLCTFLIPAVCLAACSSIVGLAAVAVGLAVSWAAWRSSAWILGVFLCLLLFGYGSEAKRERETEQRRLITASAGMGNEVYGRALATFQERPFLGSGPESFCAGDGHEPADTIKPSPWYATLIGGSGLVGLGLWIMLLGELAARALGRFRKRGLWSGGVLGGTAGLAIAGLWTDALPEGAGALVGLLIALSVLEEPEPQKSNRRLVKRIRRTVTRIFARPGEQRAMKTVPPPEESFPPDSPPPPPDDETGAQSTRTQSTV